MVLSSWGELPASPLHCLVNQSKVPQPSKSKPQNPPVSRCIAKIPSRKVNCEPHDQNEKKKKEKKKIKPLFLKPELSCLEGIKEQLVSPAVSAEGSPGLRPPQTPSKYFDRL